MKLYIFGGEGETKKNYKWLLDTVKNEYQAEFVNFDISKNSLQDLREYKIESNSVVFGFSDGALAAMKIPVKVNLGLYCSVANILGKDALTGETILRKELGNEKFEELLKMKYTRPKANKFIFMCGDKEVTPRDKIFGKKYGIKIIESTGHVLTKNYKREILKCLGFNKL